MSRYQPLAEFLAARKTDSWEASFADVEACLGFPLPESARRYPAWWANQKGGGHSQASGWQGVGWRTAGLDLERRRIRFERERPYPATAAAAAAAPDEDALFRRAHALTGIEDRTRLVEEAIRALIAREAAAGLARLGGSMPDFEAPERERS